MIYLYLFLNYLDPRKAKDEKVAPIIESHLIAIITKFLEIASLSTTDERLHMSPVSPVFHIEATVIIGLKNLLRVGTSIL